MTRLSEGRLITRVCKANVQGYNRSRPRKTLKEEEKQEKYSVGRDRTAIKKQGGM